AAPVPPAALPDGRRGAVSRAAASPGVPAGAPDRGEPGLQLPVRAVLPEAGQVPGAALRMGGAAGLLRALSVHRTALEAALRAERLGRGARQLPDADGPGRGQGGRRQRAAHPSARLLGSGPADHEPPAHAAARARPADRADPELRPRPLYL